jgi:hypothetical protein
MFLFDTASRPTLGPTQPLIQWVPGAFSLGLKQPGHETDRSPPSSKSKCKGKVVPVFFLIEHHAMKS